jgi:hypothetical protein
MTSDQNYSPLHHARLTELARPPRERLGAALRTRYEEHFGKIATHLRATLLFVDGRPPQVLDLGANLIAIQGRSNMAHLWGNDDLPNRVPTTLSFGSAGHDPLNPTQALPVNSTDTSLFSAVTISKTVTSSFPAGAGGTEVQFNATVQPTEGNGTGAQAYSELGLFDLTGRMLTHKTFGLITKSTAFGIAWTYVFLF